MNSRLKLFLSNECDTTQGWTDEWEDLMSARDGDNGIVPFAFTSSRAKEEEEELSRTFKLASTDVI